MYKKILIPIDGSKMAEKAFKYAISLAENFGEELVLLTVIPEHVVPAGAYRTWTHPSMVKRYIKIMKASAKQAAIDMLDKKMQECEKRNIKASYRILEGDPASEIIEAASKMKIDFLVIGSVGLTGIKKLKTLGSVSRKVSENASCPILIVR